MNKFLEQIRIVIVFLTVILFVGGLIITLFLKIRRLFPKIVNCWFCNKNTSVSYEKSNNWTCSNCQQYNGFNEDGDYNKEIPEQRHFKLNYSKNRSFCDKESVANYSTIASNGFCSHCNRNQELKVRQLASFVPSAEENYDEEIAEYEKHLEQAYQLCRKCSKTLKKTLTRVKSGILGTMMKQMDQKSLLDNLKAKDLKKSAIRKLVKKESQILTRICFATMLVFSIVNVFQIFQVVDISRPRMEEVLPKKIVVPLLIFISYFAAVKETLLSTLGILMSNLSFEWFSDYFEMNMSSEMSEFDIDLLMRSIGAVLSIALLVTQTERRLLKAIGLLFWNLNLHLTYFKSVGDEFTNSSIFDFFIVLCSIASTSLLWKSRNMDEEKKSVKSLDNSFHRIYSELNNDESETSDDESEFDNTIKSSSLYFGRNRTSSPNSFLKKSPLGINRSLNTTKSTSPSQFSPTNSIFTHVIPSSMQSDSFSLKSSHHTSTGYSSLRAKNNTFTKPEYDTQSMLNASFHSAGSSHNYKPSIFEQSFQRSIPQNLNHRKNIPCPGNEINSINFDSMRLGVPICNNPPLNHQFVGYSKPQQTTYKSFAQEEPTRPLSSCSRSSIIAPSRLCYNPASTASQSSWVAGGYWGTSPTKKFPAGMTSMSYDFCPIMSRTSSQTSGFESQNRDSPDDSICDEIDRTSVCSEPFSNYNRPLSNYDKSVSMNFGQPTTAPTIFSTSSSFSLKSMGRELPPIPKGRLLKMWIDKNINTTEGDQ